MRTTNWKLIRQHVSREELRDFANGNLSGRQLSDMVAFTNAAGEVRQLLRTRGVKGAREVARKAV